MAGETSGRSWARRARRLALSAMVLAFIWLGWQVLLQVSPEGPGERPEADALDEAPSGPASLRAAEREIAAEEGDVDWRRVGRVARAALEADPLEGRALFLLGLAAEAEEEEARARRLMELAGASSLRNAPAHLWLLNDRLLRGELEAGLRHADAVMRSRSALRGELQELLVGLAATREGAAALAGLLAEDPPWRGWFLRTLSRSDDPGAAAPLFLALSETARPPSAAELRRHLLSLVNQGSFREAWFLWRALEEDAEDGRYLYNAEFSRPLTDQPFDWMLHAPAGVAADVVRPDFGGAPRLRLQFAKARVARARQVSKLLMLPPGSYRLTGSAETDRLANPRGLRWRVACAEANEEELGASRSFRGDTPRQDFALDFEVPAADCRAQWLRLELDARTARERDVAGGRAWFDSLSLTRLSDRRP